MNYKRPWKQGIKTGIILGICSIGLFIIADTLNHHLGWGLSPMTIRGLTGIITLIILGLGIYEGMASVKRQNNGVLTYRQALLSGVIISLIAGAVLSLFTLVYCAYINPGFTAYMLSESKKVMVAEGLSPSIIAGRLTAIAKQLTTSAQVMEAFVGQSVAGTAIAAVMGLFTKAEK